MQWIYALVGGIIVGLIVFIICRIIPQQQIRKINEEHIAHERAALQELESQQRNIEASINTKQLQQAEEEKKLQILRTKVDETDRYYKNSQAQAEDAAKTFYDNQMKLAEEKLEHALEKNGAKYQEGEEECRAEYEQVIADLLATARQMSQQVEAAQAQLAEYQSKVAAATEAAKRAELDREKKDFYRLQLSDIDIEEIAKLRSVEPYLRNKEPLNKVIYKVYYEKPYTDLIGRVVGAKSKTGIYKITNLENQMCYVGQAINIAERWKQHIKRGIGAEQPTRNKLYPAMLALGVENFTFEIIEECKPQDLNAREDYWQDYFKAKEYGYSIK